MKYNPEKHHRKSIRLKGYDYSSNGGYFVTICVKNRECLFGEIINGEMKLSEIGKIAYDNWFSIPEHFSNVLIDEFVIMPNHLHGIILINSENDDLLPSGRVVIYNNPTINDSNNTNDIKNQYYSDLSPLKNTLSVIIRTYKSSVTRNCKKNDIYFQWQRNYHDWIIKNENHLERFRNYIYQNPLKWEIDSENPIKINKGK